jgi:hypothetical protein
LVPFSRHSKKVVVLGLNLRMNELAVCTFVAFIPKSALKGLQLINRVCESALEVKAW